MTELPEIDRIQARESGRFLNLPEQGGDIDLRELLRKLWRRRRVILGCVFIITALATVVSFQLTPQYSASALVMIEPRESRVVDIEAVLSGLPPDTETINSEIEVIKSRQLAKRVIDRLKLEEDPEFNAALRKKSFWASIVNIRSYLPADIFPVKRLSEEERALRQTTQVIDVFVGKMGVGVKLRSWVIEVSYNSDEAQKSARIVNAIVDLYIVEQLEAKYEATKVATEWLSGRLGVLRQQVEVTERVVANYRREVGLVEGKDSVDVAAQQLSEINTQLVLSTTRRAEAEARLQQVERLLSTQNDASSVGEVLSSALIQRLLEQESELIRQSAELTAEYGPKHPRMINAKAEIRDLRAKIGIEVKKILLGLKSEVEVSRAREKSLASTLKRLEGRIGTLSQKQVLLRSLERDADANRVLYETFLARFKEMSGQRELQTPDARVISYSGVPTAPSYPRKSLIVAFAFIGSLAFGVSLVFAIEQLDSGFRSMEQVEAQTNVPALGLVPQVRARKDTPPERIVLDEPLSAYSESIRNLFVSLMLSNVDKPPKIILITSAMPEEGKSVMSTSLARTVALSGRKTVVIDCDLRRPRIHEALDIQRSPGLVELLAQRAELDDVVQVDEASGAHVITSGEHIANSSDIMGSEQMKRLLVDLGGKYDMVILDSPPVLAVTDARVLSAYADKTVFVVRWEKTRREAAILALRQLKVAGANIAGVVLSKVDVKRHAGYGFADSGYYHGKYKKYYQS